jgi:hypothetical protein
MKSKEEVKMKLKTIIGVAITACLLLTSQALSVVGYGLAPYPKFKAYISGTSDPLVGGLLYTCKVGTVCGPAPAFPQTTYTDALGGGVNANPVVLDANGEANVWLPTYTKLALYDASGVLIWTVDNVPPSGWTALPLGATEVRTSSYADLDTAIAAIGASDVVLICDSAIGVAANLTVPANVQMVTEPSCSISVPPAVTLTINGPFEAGLYQVFDCVGTGAVTFGSGSVSGIYPEWWGIDGTADDVQINQQSWRLWGAETL